MNDMREHMRRAYLDHLTYGTSFLVVDRPADDNPPKGNRMVAQQEQTAPPGWGFYLRPRPDDEPKFVSAGGAPLVDAEKWDEAVLPARGDKVELTKLTAYVGNVNDDGTYQLATTRDAYPDAIELDQVHASYLTVKERHLARHIGPGDVITGAEVRATRWKRGAVISGVVANQLYVLLESGAWQEIDSPNDEFAFDEVEDDESFVVEYAPGK